MQVPNLFRVAIVVVALALPRLSFSQSISSEERTGAIQSIAKHIAANYVNPEKGGQIASHIQIAHHRGEFNKASNWQQFDEMVTASLRNFSKDEHLYVRFDPQEVAKLKGNKNDTNRMYVGAPDANDTEKTNNYGFAEIKLLQGNVGYIKLSEINISQNSLPVLYDAMRQVKNTKALIIDLRDNTGGSSDAGAVLESYFLPKGTPLLEFYSRKGTSNIVSTVDWLSEKKYDKPLFILVNNRTASAAEAIAFVLQQHKRAKIVGEKTAGAAYMNEWFAINDQNYVSVSTSSPNIPGTVETWQGVGVRPDIKVKNGDPVSVVMAKIAG